MIVVSDTTPIISLMKAGQLEFIYRHLMRGCWLGKMWKDVLNS